MFLMGFLSLDDRNELVQFIEMVYPTYDAIVSRPFITQKDLNELFGYLLQKSREFVLDNPYWEQNFDKIFTLVRADGVVTIDITSQDLNAIMVQIKQTQQPLTNVSVIRYNSPTNPNIPLTYLIVKYFLPSNNIVTVQSIYSICLQQELNLS